MKPRGILMLVAGTILIILAISSVSYAAIRNTQLARLTECTNRAIISGYIAIKSRDIPALDLNRINQNTIHARQHLFDLFVRTQRGEELKPGELDVAYAEYLTASKQYDDAIARFSDSIMDAPLLVDGKC